MWGKRQRQHRWKAVALGMDLRSRDVNYAASTLRNLRSQRECRFAGFLPGFGCQQPEPGHAHLRHPGEHFAQVVDRVDAALAAVLDDGVEDRPAFARRGLADEQPVLLFMLISA